MKKKSIALINVSKVYKTGSETLLAINNIEFSVDAEEVVSIMGPSGCGKSTILNIIGGIEKPSSGKIMLDDSTYADGVTREALRKIGFVFQNDNLLHWRTIEKNLDFPIEILGLSGEKWETRKNELLQIVGLSDYRNAYPFELSGGMKQRISVIRALMHDPKILLMDQPFGALDAITRKMLSREFLELWKKTRKTIVMITNDLDEALLLSHRILIMDHCPGEIISEIEVDIPIEERDEHLIKNKKYSELRKKLRKIFADDDVSVKRA